MERTIHYIGKERPALEGRNDPTSEGKSDREVVFLVFCSFLIWTKGLDLFFIVDILYIC
jgi:hypothetical protein